MDEVVPGLFSFSGLLVGRVYLIQDGHELTLVDAGLGSAANPVLGQLRKAGFEPHQVKRILITHAHPDHIGGLPVLQAATGATVIASALEQPVIEGQEPIPRAPGPLRMPEMRFSGTRVSWSVNDGEVLWEVMNGLQVLWTPGHAPGHLAYWQPEQRILFCGDVIFHMPWGLRQPLAILTADAAENRRSIKRLAELDAQVICFGHGSPLKQDAAAHLRVFSDRL